MKTLLIILLTAITSVAFSQTIYYVEEPSHATANGRTASDANAGTNINLPWATWQKAWSIADAADTVFFRGGVWYPTGFNQYGQQVVYSHPRAWLNLLPNPTHVGHDGTAGNYIHFFAYPGEKPILDLTNVYPTNYKSGYVSGISMEWANYIHLKGLTIRNIFDRDSAVHCQGISLSGGSNLIIENCELYNIDGEAIYIGVSGGYTLWGSGIETDTVKIINTDIHDCWNHHDLGSNPGGWADGVKSTNGAAIQKIVGADTTWGDDDGYILYDGCRVWNTSDDALDPGGTGRLEIRNCWLFDNGHLNGDGSGVKTGGSTLGYHNPRINRLIHHNLMVWNRGCGIQMVEYPNYQRLHARIYNNTIYKPRWGVSMSGNAKHPNSESIFYNNLIYQPRGKDQAQRPMLVETTGYIYYGASHNTFRHMEYGSLPAFGINDTITVTDADFVLSAGTAQDSIAAYAQLTQARKADWSLPDITFLTLAEGSDLIDAGINPVSDTANLVIPYNGTAPDIGKFEYDGAAENVPVINITVTGTNTITINNGTTQLSVTVAPTNATNKAVTWTITNGTGSATISATGLVTAVTNGIVTARATAQDGSGEYGTMVITISGQSVASTATDILTFVLANQTGAATINATNHTVSIQTIFGTNVTVLTPTITLSAGASISLASGVTRDFTNPVTYTVTAEDGTTTQAWTVTVIVAAGSPAKNITSFVFSTQAVVASINNSAHTVTVSVTDEVIIDLTPTITISPNATINPTSGTARDFTNPVTYTVTAQDGSSQVWTVTVTPAGFVPLGTKRVRIKYNGSKTIVQGTTKRIRI